MKSFLRMFAIRQLRGRDGKKGGDTKCNDSKMNPMPIDISARGTEKAEIVEVIKTTSTVGNGTHENPTREQIRYWDLAGTLLCDYHPGKMQRG